MILINGRFLLHRVTGVERYAKEIVKELDKLAKPGEIEMAIPPGVEEIPDYKNIEIVVVGKLHNRLWEHISFPLYVKKRKGVSLNLCNVAPLLSPGIVCIHDVKIKARPQDFSFKFLLWYSFLFFNACRRANRLLTVSEFSKKEIAKYYGVDLKKITVIPNAWQQFENIQFDDKTLKKYELIENKFYFSMCSLEPNKNLNWVAQTAMENPKEIFAIAGSINKSVFSNGLGIECPDNVKLLGYVSDEEAKTLMRDCKAFLFPTFYEGFGIPPLEALSVGCSRIIVTDNEVMHEVLEDAATYINPYFYHLPVSNGTSHKSIDKVLEKYSWKKSAEKLYKLIKW